jgi:hypothetical protein
MSIALPTPDRFEPQTIRKAICLTLAKAGIKMPISRAMIAITTNNSTNVKPFLFLFIFCLLYSFRDPQRQPLLGTLLLLFCLLI